jgi:DNA-binding response OmpR family regulator
MKILIIDDEEDIRRIVRLGLEQAGGMKVCEAASGAEGVQAARRDHPDAILLDVMMPAMDGPATLLALRSDPEIAAIPVIFLTVRMAPEEMSRFEGLGVAGVIVKPFDPMTLTDRLHALLEHGARNSANDLASMLSALHREYRHALPEKLERLSHLASRAEAAPLDATARAELETALHNLQGTAGSYGFARISRIAGEWEAELKADGGPNPVRRAAHFLAALSSPRVATDEPPRSLLPVQPAVPAEGAPDVLIVDDDPEMVAFLAALFRSDGLRVETAGDGREALGRLSMARPALIISDISMPGIDGYELCRTVRARGFQDIPFIFCTVLGQKPLRVEGLHCGADDYLVKPVDPDELRLKVRNHIARLKRLRGLVPAPGLMRGSLAEFDLTLVLQMLGQREAAGTTRLLLQRGDERGEIRLDGGNPVHAVAGEFTGPKALFRLLDWHTGEFRLEPAERAGEVTLAGGIEGLLIEGMRHLDECRLLKIRLKHVELRPEARSAEHVAPEEIGRLLGAIRQGHSLDEVLNLSPLPDLEILRRLNTLAGAGILRVMGEP